MFFIVQFILDVGYCSLLEARQEQSKGQGFLCSLQNIDCSSAEVLILFSLPHLLRKKKDTKQQTAPAVLYGGIALTHY
jgi:hypothetical protein